MEQHTHQATTNQPNDRRSRRRAIVWRALAIGVVLALVASACGGDDADHFSPTAGGEAADTTAAPATTAAPSRGAGAGDQAVGGGAAQEEGGDGGITPTALPTNINRDIIFTADLLIAVTDVAAAGAEATQRMEALGGFLFGQQTSGGAEPRSVLIFKIIPEQFQTALEQLGSIGDLRNQSVSADDVTERVVNLESQIATNEASVERLRGLLEGVGSVEELAQLEAQLLARETNLEQLRGTLRTLEDQVALATITVTIEPARLRPGIEVFASAYPGFEDSGSSCPGSADQLIVDEGTFATVCWEVRNIGDTDLTGFQLTDTVLDVTLDDLIVVEGNPGGVLDVGDTMTLALGVEVDRRLRAQTRISAVPITADGVVLEDRPVANTTSVTLRSEDPGGIPSFGEGLSRSWNALVGVFKLALLAAGLALPFLWVPVIVYFGALMLRRRTDRRRDEAREAAEVRQAEQAARNAAAAEARAAVAAETDAGENDAVDVDQSDETDAADEH